MSQKQVKPMMVFLFMLMALSTLSARAGRDSYEIFLNGRLLLRQVVVQPFSLKSLSLDARNTQDNLVIYYSQCNAPARSVKGRSITLRDGRGKILREWKFSDAGDGDGRMSIPVKEILSLSKGNAAGSLQFYYASESRPEGQALVSMQAGGKVTMSDVPATRAYARRHGIGA